tara:strand:+ start:270 stop:701 length:432 start_codon:yes stop_codon:yes gene_type:complete
MKTKNEKFLIILIILFAAISFSLAHPIIFGYGVEFIESENSSNEIKLGESKIIKVHIQTFIQEKIKTSIEIKFDNPEDKNFLELKENEIIKNAALNYYQKTYFDLNVTSLDSIPEDQPIKLNLELYKNGEFMDSATLEIYVIP